MELQQVRQAIKATPRGCNIVCEWERPCKTRKGVSALITKHVRMVGRMGIEYDNINDVQEKREEGTLPAVNAGLPWGQWSEYPWLIEHKGKFYLRLYNGTSALTTPKATFFNNGVEVSKASIAPLLLAAELAEKDGDCFCCAIENLLRVHCEQVYTEVEQVTSVPEQVEQVKTKQQETTEA